MVYLVIWWVVIFAVLPWGVRVPETHEPGHATSAPEDPKLGRKAAITTAISAVIWIGVYLIVQSDLVTLREP